MDNAPDVKRSLFGYRKEDVESILEARERMFETATEEVNRRREEAEQLRLDLEKARAETRAAREETQSVRGELNSQLDDLRRELETVRADLERLEERRRDAETRASAVEAEARDAQREAAGLRDRLRIADTTDAELRARLEGAGSPAAETRDLGAVLEATQEAIGHIIADARRAAEDDLSRVQRRRDEIQAEVDRVRRWRERIEPVSQGIAGEIAMAQQQMSKTAERVGEALRPMSDALAGLSKHLGELATTADPTVADAVAQRPDHVDLASYEQERVAAAAGRAPEDAPTAAPPRSDR